MSEPVRYQFVCQGMPEDTFAVNWLRGEEALSQPYRFEIELRSQNADVDFDLLMSRACRLSIWVDGKERRIHGVLSGCDMLRQAGKFSLYRVVLVPRLWQLGLYQANEVFLDKSVPEILRMVLEEGGFTALDYEMNLIRQYRKWPYRCQYGETHLNFLQRLMEREGMYYYFEQGEDGEKLVIVDHLQFHESIDQPNLDYDPHSGLEGEHFGNSVQSLVCRRSRIARTVLLRDYNDDKPSVDIKGQAEVDPEGVGEVNVFGLNILSPEEGNELAEIRAEQIRAGKEVFHGESTVGRLAPGFTFKLQRHYRSSLNQSYLVTAISHQGLDPLSLTLGVTPGVDLADNESYKNSFTAISSQVQYRPEPTAQKTLIHGTLDAVVDAEGDGTYAEVDSEGRYKIILPFDRQLRDEGKASHWIRMSQTFAGEREGMHFPLRKGAHVLLSFIGGDPDRPVITGALPNAAQPSVVTSENQTKSKILTRAGNMIEMEDREDSKRIKFYTPHRNTYMHLGAHNAPGDGVVTVSEGLSRMEIAGGTQNTWVARVVFEDMRDNQHPAIQTDEEDQLFDEQEIFEFQRRDELGHAIGPMTNEDELSGNYHIQRRLGDTYIYTEGNEFIFGGDGGTFSFGSSYEESHINEDALDSEEPEEVFDFPESIEGAQGYDLDNSYVSKSWGDSVEYNNGNTYSWGDGCDYSFGGGYAENHISGTDDKINQKDWPHDLCPPPPHEDGDKIKGSKLTLIISDSDIEKTFGPSYEYSKGNSIEVSVGDSEEHSYGNSYEFQHGGRHEETVYSSKGIKLSHSTFEDGNEYEWIYHPAQGALNSFSCSAQGGTANFEAKLMPTIDLTIDVSTLSTEVEICTNTFEFRVAAGSTEVSVTGGQLEINVVGFKFEIVNSNFEMILGPLKTEGTLVELNNKLTTFRAEATSIKNRVMDNSNTGITLGQGLTELKNAFVTMFN